ncbi:hypothetical protein O181_006199 [Austropuccinia psidii MF-1]|uniref:Uncharacterized protein n=1 Tax=Austropuccinia psidii MF-1 TaxID=1389203 RepID=A0A9Q3BIW7_9BASI|nr:hypothetical protein [Austropuccinia psidii MF-1]
MVSQSHESDVLPIMSEEEQSHQVIVPTEENPHHNPSAQNENNHFCKSLLNSSLSNETPFHSREHVHQVSPIILAANINAMLKTQNIQSTIPTPHNDAPTPCVRSSPHDTLM